MGIKWHTLLTRILAFTECMGIYAGLYGENSPDIVEQAGRILGLPLDTVFNLQLPEGNPDELASPFPGQPSVSACPTARGS